MDTDLLKTFLEVARTRHFGRAADNLYLTQSAVSSRVRTLEETLKVRLFERQRNNIHLTPAGRKLVQYAESILGAWSRARHELAQADDAVATLSVGGLPSLWDSLLQDWIHRLHRALPELSITAEVLGAEPLVRRVLERTLDLGVLFEAPRIPEIRVETLGRIDLVLVSSRPDMDPEAALSRDYVLVDWGTAFATTHARLFPDTPPPRVRVGLGRLARAFLRECGGNAYLAAPMVAEDLARGRLFRVEGAPIIPRDTCLIHHRDAEPGEAVIRALGLLHPPDSGP